MSHQAFQTEKALPRATHALCASRTHWSAPGDRVRHVLPMDAPDSTGQHPVRPNTKCSFSLYELLGACAPRCESVSPSMLVQISERRPPVFLLYLVSFCFHATQTAVVSTRARGCPHTLGCHSPDHPGRVAKEAPNADSPCAAASLRCRSGAAAIDRTRRSRAHLPRYRLLDSRARLQ